MHMSQSRYSDHFNVLSWCPTSTHKNTVAQYHRTEQECSRWRSREHSTRKWIVLCTDHSIPAVRLPFLQFCVQRFGPNILKPRFLYIANLYVSRYWIMCAAKKRKMLILFKIPFAIWFATLFSIKFLFLVIFCCINHSFVICSVCY